MRATGHPQVTEARNAIQRALGRDDSGTQDANDRAILQACLDLLDGRRPDPTVLATLDRRVEGPDRMMRAERDRTR